MPGPRSNRPGGGSFSESATYSVHGQEAGLQARKQTDVGQRAKVTSDSPTVAVPGEFPERVNAARMRPDGSPCAATDWARSNIAYAPVKAVP